MVVSPWQKHIVQVVWLLAWVSATIIYDFTPVCTIEGLYIYVASSIYICVLVCLKIIYHILSKIYFTVIGSENEILRKLLNSLCTNGLREPFQSISSPNPSPVSSGWNSRAD